MGRFIGKQGKNLLAKPQEAEGRNLLAESDSVIPPKRAGFKDFAVGGAPGFSVMPGAEDVLPMVGQTLGGKFGPMAAGGAAVGEMARQSIKTIRGDRSGIKDPTSLGFGGIGLPRAIPSVAREAMGTLASEGVFRGLPKLAFAKQYGGKAREAAGKALGTIRKKVMEKAPFLRMAKNDIVQRIDDALASAPFESGPQRQALIRIKNRLANVKKPLTFDESVQLEQEIGRQASFAEDATSGVFKKGPKAPRSNEALKTERARVSGKVDEMASLAGFPEHEAKSLAYSKLAKKYPEKDLQKMYSPTGQFIRGATFGGGAALPLAFGGGPLTALLAPLAVWANIPPKYKTALFRKVIDTPVGRGVGRGLTLGTAEIARRLSDLGQS